MTTYTDIPNADIDQNSPVKVALMTALRDNALAIQEGDASAPSLLDGIAAKVSAGAVGSYAFLATLTGPAAGHGTAMAGSLLFYAGALSDADITGVDFDFVSTSSPSGTWLCMGYSTRDYIGSGYYIYAGTLWVRIA